MILNPAAFSDGTASGGGASAKSIWPERRAATRVVASGSGSSISFSHLGTRALFQ